MPDFDEMLRSGEEKRPDNNAVLRGSMATVPFPLDFDWQDLASSGNWLDWREAKIRSAEDLISLPPVTMDSLESPQPDALAEISRRCASGNFVVYRTARRPAGLDEASHALAEFARRLGLARSEEHRSASAMGVVALQTSDDPARKGYIPYTRKPMNWHTDGYYNPSGRPVLSFILHCHAQAHAGGENQLLDPELAYLAMRDENSDFVRAMMHPEAMTIPENREADGSLRPASTGPVFFADPASGRLQMRYTARTRSIHWRDTALTRAAADWLRGWLASDACPAWRVRLKPGEGIVSNNALHNRTGFAEDGGAARTVLRMRFHDRLAETANGPA